MKNKLLSIGLLVALAACLSTCVGCATTQHKKPTVANWPPEPVNKDVNPVGYVFKQDFK